MTMDRHGRCAMSPLPDSVEIGRRMHAFMAGLFPICRLITGDGLGQTLAAVARKVPLALHEVPTGTSVLDWTIPREWNYRDAWVKGSGGRKVIDAGRHNLHLLNYSVPIHRKMSLAELRPHLHSLPD